MKQTDQPYLNNNENLQQLLTAAASFFGSLSIRTDGLYKIKSGSE
ncbi:hypothetical protein [Enterococcus faecium]|nr:hypothetical protein [Enterococcus faecium]